MLFIYPAATQPPGYNFLDYNFLTSFCILCRRWLPFTMPVSRLTAHQPQLQILFSMLIKPLIVLFEDSEQPAIYRHLSDQEELYDLALVLERIDVGAGERGLVIPTNQQTNLSAMPMLMLSATPIII